METYLRIFGRLLRSVQLSRSVRAQAWLVVYMEVDDLGTHRSGARSETRSEALRALAERSPTCRPSPKLQALSPKRAG